MITIDDFLPVSELPETDYRGIPMLVRVQLVHGGFLRDRFAYRIDNILQSCSFGNGQ